MMAPYAQLVTTSLLLSILPGFFCLRYGSRSQTLHIPEVTEAEYYGKGFQIIDTSSSSTNEPVHNRVKRQTNMQSSSIIAHEVGLNDSHYQMIIHWAGEGSKVIVALTKDVKPDENSTSNVYISRDYGDTFQIIDYLAHVTVDKYYNSPVSNSFYVFTDVIHKKMYTTTDYAETFQEITLQFVPRLISLHPSDPSVMLAYDEEHVEKPLWVTRNFGQTWQMMQLEVKTFFWANSTMDKTYTLYVEKHVASATTGHVIMSDDFFATSRRLIDDVLDFQLVNDYMFVSRQKDNSSMEIFVSYKRQPFVKADFPYNDTHKDYYVAYAAEDQVFLCVYHNRTSTHLYMSDVTGQHYSLSLINIVYFNPKYHNESLLNMRRDKPFADVHHVSGLRGFFIASQFQTSNFTLNNQKTLITVNAGSSWRNINAPYVDSHGNTTDCLDDYSYAFYGYGSACNLHLAQYFHLFHPLARSQPILSKETAIGIVMATGSIGNSLGSDLNIYVSRDGGLGWKEVFKGPHFYAYGDFGGLIVAVRQMELTGEIFYSVKGGSTWTSLEFSQEKVLVYGLLSEPGENSTVFSIFSSYPFKHEWLIIKVDLRNAISNKCTAEDYKDWSPTDNFHVNCILGQKVTFRRRRANAVCYSGGEFEREVLASNCTCTSNDYECDEGFTRGYSWLSTCEWDKESTINVTAVPNPCPEGTYYLRTKGYRRIAGDTCQGGMESRLEPDKILCPVLEQDEFLLFTTRRSIHRWSFTTQTDEVIPIDGLEDVVALEFDYQKNCLFWADMRQNVIKKVCLSRGSSREQITIISDRLGTVESLALDWLSNILYWVDSDTAKIEMARTDGSHRKLLFSNMTKFTSSDVHLEKPRSLTLFPKYGLMFWSDWSLHPSITKAYMDGKNVTVLVSSRFVSWPNGLVIDDIAERLYWTDSSKHGIYSVSIHGGFPQTILENALWLPHPYAISLYKNELYWTDWSRLAVFKTSIQGDGRVHSVISNLTGVMDMKIMHFASQQAQPPSPCYVNNGNCASICVERPHNDNVYLPLNRTCLCADNFENIILMPDGSEHCECGSGETVDHEGSCIRNNVNSTCQPDQFACMNGKCIPKMWQCDRDHDCGPDDASDELDCPYETCAPGLFTCKNNHCINSVWVCDRDFDCGPGDRSDEPDSCEYSTCGSDEFTCANGHCVKRLWLCDGDDDCHDRSDENSTSCLRHENMTSCIPEQFTCNNGICIPQHWVCDGTDDCGNMLDEENCNGTVVLSNCSSQWQYRCQTEQCIQIDWLCDGENDCSDGEDERDCSTFRPFPPFTSNCTFDSFDCGNTVCVPISKLCDGVDDCGNNSDEDFCDEPELPEPTPFSRTTSSPDCHHDNDFLCADGQCIFESWVCDGHADCRNGDDEVDCKDAKQCPSTYFRCYSVAGCIPTTFLCDGSSDCADNSDETNCQNSTLPVLTCRSDEFKCDGTCLAMHYKCDGVRDCMDETDEVGCGSVKYIFQQLYVVPVDLSKAKVYWGRTLPLPPVNKSVAVVIFHRSSGTTQWINQTSPVTSGFYGVVFNEGLSPGIQYEYTVALSIDGVVSDRMPVQTFSTGDKPPGAPEDLRLQVQPGPGDQLILHVQWQEPKLTNGQIRNYTVYARMNGGIPIIRHVPVSPGPPPSYYAVNFINFFEDTVVSVKVTARNTLEGDATNEISISINVPNLPHCSSFIYNAVDIEYGTSTRVQWKYNGNTNVDKIEKFRLIFIPGLTLGVNITKEFIMHDLLISNDIFAANVSGWSPGLSYYGYVQAYNISGYGSTCMDRNMLISVKGTPLLSPGLHIEQDPISKEVRLNVTIPGKPIWYRSDWNPEVKVFYTRNPMSFLWANSLQEDIKSVDVVGGNAVIAGLYACTEYQFKTQIMSPVCSKLGTSQTFTTSEDAKSQPKDVLLTVSEISETKANLIVNFTSPCDKQMGVIPMGYIISVFEVWPNNSAGIHHGFPLYSTSKYVSYTVHDLNRGAYYNVSVSLDDSDARYSDIKQIIIHPHQAPTHLEVLPNLENAILFLKWKPPRIPPKMQNLSYGVYYGTGSGDLQMQKLVQDSEFIFLNLEPDMIHKFRVRLENVYGYPGEFSPIETYRTPTKEKWKMYWSLTSSPAGMSNSMLSAIIIPCVLVVFILATALTVYVVKHRRLQHSFMSYANSHYDTRSGTARFSTSDDLDDEDQPMIQGFSDDEPLIIA